MVFRLGSVNNGRVIGPTNKALTNIAQLRVDSIVARAVDRHRNALRVDGSDLYMWGRGFGGLVCTCRQPPKALEASLINYSAEGLRLPNVENNFTPDASSSNPVFKIKHSRGNLETGTKPQALPEDFTGLADEIYADSAEIELDNFATLDPIEGENTDAQLAFMLNNGAAISGGDKTACGICFGTGKTHGYDLITGRRMVLDASNEFPYTCIGGAQTLPSTYPTQFSLTVNQYVEWLVNLPSYTNGWLNFTIRDNLISARNLTLEWYQKNTWQPLTLTGLTATEGSDRQATRIRVRATETEDFFKNTFTHVELIYSTTNPMLGQCPPLNLANNYETQEPLITTEFEILANVQDIPRESVFQDSKFKYLWKVLDITPKMTAKGQIFSYNVTARLIHRSEPLYALRVIFDPQINVHYRGLEIIEGDVEEDDIDFRGSNSLTFKLRTSS